MKERILKLKNEGKSYGDIKKILGCSKGTISYHCGTGQKQKTLNRSRQNRKTTDIKIRRKIEVYLRPKIRNYRRGKGNRITTAKFDCGVAYKIIINNPICYLTGRKIDLSDTKSYQLDHKIPIKKGGPNTLKNMGLSCRDANMGKGDLLLDEFIQMCKEVCEHNGYKVHKDA